MSIQIAGIDTKKGLDLYDDELDIYLVVLRSYVEHMPATLNKMRKVSAETLLDYAVAVHTVKGASANIGAEEVRQSALHLEMMAKADNLAGVLAENEKFLKRVDTLVNDIRNWLKKNGHL